MQRKEYPERPVLCAGGVVIRDGQVLLARRGTEPLRGEWSIPGGRVELGETLAEAVVRELREETGVTVRVLDLIDVVDRIFPAAQDNRAVPGRSRGGPLYHFVVADYLCELLEGEPQPGSDTEEIALVREEELSDYRLSPQTERVLRKAFALARSHTRQP